MNTFLSLISYRWASFWICWFSDEEKWWWCDMFIAYIQCICKATTSTSFHIWHVFHDYWIHKETIQSSEASQSYCFDIIGKSQLHYFKLEDPISKFWTPKEKIILIANFARVLDILYISCSTCTQFHIISVILQMFIKS